MRKKLGILLVIVLFLYLVSAADFPSPTDKYVNDFAKVLNTEQSSQLRDLFSNVEAVSTAEVVFVSVQACSPYAPSDYAIQLGNQWGIGKKDKSNGLLILYCFQENKIFVATGYGLEGILPDSKIGRLLDDYYVPLRDSGNVTEGIVKFSQQASQIIIDDKDEVISGTSGTSGSSGFDFAWIYIVAFVILFLFIISYIKKLKTKEKKSDKKTGTTTEIKKSSGYADLLATGLLLAVGFITANFVLGILAFLISRPIFSAMFGIRCGKDGLRMKKLKKDGSYTYYKCPNGHIGKIAAATAAGYFIGQSLAGHSGGGGFSGGGGGFGGGGFGGGGAGR